MDPARYGQIDTACSLQECPARVAGRCLEPFGDGLPSYRCPTAGRPPTVETECRSGHQRLTQRCPPPRYVLDYLSSSYPLPFVLASELGNFRRRRAVFQSIG